MATNRKHFFLMCTSFAIKVAAVMNGSDRMKLNQMLVCGKGKHFRVFEE
jgi:hypothetical protein